VSAVACPVCGSLNRLGSRFCGTCGRRLPQDRTAYSIGRYTSLRFQIDPTDPPPTRDLRWVLLITGACLVLVGLLLLSADVIVTGALGLSGSSCSAPSGACGVPVFTYVFLVPGIALVSIGFVMALIGLRLARRW
jgi:hypothetical protein